MKKKMMGRYQKSQKTPKKHLKIDLNGTMETP